MWTRSTRRKVAICWTRGHLCHRNSCQQSKRFNYNCHVEINHGKHSQPVKFEDILAQHFHVHTTPELFRDIHGRFSKGFAVAVVMLVFLEQSQADVVLNSTYVPILSSKQRHTLLLGDRMPRHQTQSSTFSRNPRDE